MLLRSDIIILLRVVVAAALCMAVGLERMSAGAPIRARTLVLVTMTTTLLMGFADETYHGVSDRVVQGLVTGMGFLGAGIIMHSTPDEVRGLTTAATLWAMGAVGIVIGSGRVLLGILLTLLIYGFIALSDSSLVARALKWAADRRVENAGNHDDHPPA
ncbi:MAG: MgtC/SapB family protein [Anaerolineae bacterium]|nr:MgtC/SapB family protein [Anaerolineae bacterium]HNS40580.1 MgtC/SapB family protein [Promineifilum sp.]